MRLGVARELRKKTCTQRRAGLGSTAHALMEHTSYHNSPCVMGNLSTSGGEGLRCLCRRLRMWAFSGCRHPGGSVQITVWHTLVSYLQLYTLPTFALRRKALPFPRVLRCCCPFNNAHSLRTSSPLTLYRGMRVLYAYSFRSPCSFVWALYGNTQFTGHVESKLSCSLCF